MSTGDKLSKEEPTKEDVKYGLIVIDPEDIDENGDVAIVHFCGYIEEPTKEDALNLREELATDEEFGLTDIVERLEIFPAPEEIVKIFVEAVSEAEKEK